ncbi:unnamed protein product, partial [Thlaspi arvense]
MMSVPTIRFLELELKRGTIKSSRYNVYCLATMVPSDCQFVAYLLETDCLRRVMAIDKDCSRRVILMVMKEKEKQKMIMTVMIVIMDIFHMSR